ncbi:class I SAM-dependent methyltransferase [Bradyrhizobium sp. NAS80.1]|uniref:class I SAM-dependent methyltransferase n=1 Tax=Bradyrhizobium sp. NAS80.1 TaxID=1680159 RepID=UPI00143D4AC0|nr:class I SAM-dependent methyltransferase [Bradyrhizobium sp. NAS80.1]
MRTSDRAFYAGSVGYFDAENKSHIISHLDVVKSYISAVSDSLEQFCRARGGNVRFLELGAGTCLTSLSLRKIYPQASFTCADISLSRMQLLLGKAADLVGVHANGIELAECDMSNKLPFENEQFDIVIFDASLHHSCNIWLTLAECRRILAPDGAVAALREQYLAPLTAGYALRRLLRTKEVQSGVAENAFLKEQYAYYFAANGFVPTFHSVTPGARWRMLSPLNGLLFSKWSIWAPVTR